MDIEVSQFMIPSLRKFGEKLRDLNKDLFVRQTHHPYVDKVTYRGKDLMSIPKGGKVERAFFNNYIGYDNPNQKERDKFSHRSLAGLLDNLVRLRLIRPEQRRKWIGR